MKHHSLSSVLWITLLGFVMLSSCASPRDIAYFQDIHARDTVSAVTTPVDILIRPKDKLSIIVNSQDQRLTSLFNLPTYTQQIGQETSGGSQGSSRGLSGYTVDSEGDIDFPVIGKIHVQGLTREKIADHIKSELTSRNLVKDPVITVEFQNLNFSVLGEVSRPGRYAIDKDNITILDALSQAGDLTIYGKRGNIRVLRIEGGTRHAYSINLCSSNDLYKSPAYYLQQNDVVYVEPNDTKARQSTVNGNNVRSTSFWFSLASLLTTLTVLIVK